MSSNPYVNRVDYVAGGVTHTLIDITSDTVTPSTLLQGYTAHDASGAAIVGTATGGGSGAVTQDAQGYLVLSDQGGGSGGGTTILKMGAIRPDAELVQSWTYDKLLVEDEGKTLGSAYTTNNLTYITATALSPTITLDFDNYDYLVTERALSTPVYTTSDTAAGRAIYSCQTYVYEPVNLSMFNSAVAPCHFYWYYSSPTTISTTLIRSGANVTFGIPQQSNSVLTLRTPALAIQGHAIYFTQTYWDCLEDVRYQYIIEVWRAPKNSSNINGFATSSLQYHVLDCAQSASGTLT